ESRQLEGEGPGLASEGVDDVPSGVGVLLAELSRDVPGADAGGEGEPAVGVGEDGDEGAEGGGAHRGFGDDEARVEPFVEERAGDALDEALLVADEQAVDDEEDVHSRSLRLVVRAAELELGGRGVVVLE